MYADVLHVDALQMQDLVVGQHLEALLGHHLGVFEPHPPQSRVPSREQMQRRVPYQLLLAHHLQQTLRKLVKDEELGVAEAHALLRAAAPHGGNIGQVIVL